MHGMTRGARNSACLSPPGEVSLGGLFLFIDGVDNKTFEYATRDRETLFIFGSGEEVSKEIRE